MITGDDFVKHITSGQPTKYKEEKHIKLLLDIFGNGEGVAAFCAEALISKNTFFSWLKVHQEFKEAYDIAISIAARKWEAYPLRNPDFNFPYWSIIMRNRFGYGKSKFTLSEDKTPSSIVDSVLIGLENGEITAQEASQVANLAMTKANIKANETIDNQSSTIRETRESLLEKIDKIQKIIDYAKSEEDK